MSKELDHFRCRQEHIQSISRDIYGYTTPYYSYFPIDISYICGYTRDMINNKKILLALPNTMLTKLDEYCKANGYERSELVRHLLRLKLDWIDDRGYVKETISSEVPEGQKIIQKKEKAPSNKPHDAGNDYIVKEEDRHVILDTAQVPVLITPKNVKEVIQELNPSGNMGLWRCPHGNIGKFCKHPKCNIDARKYV